MLRIIKIVRTTLLVAAVLIIIRRIINKNTKNHKNSDKTYRGPYIRFSTICLRTSKSFEKSSL